MPPSLQSLFQLCRNPLVLLRVAALSALPRAGELAPPHTPLVISRRVGKMDKTSVYRLPRPSGTKEFAMTNRSNTNLTGRTALVTGSTSGLGKAIAVQLATAGAHVIVHGRNAERGAAVVGEIEAAGGTARFIAGDLSNLADLARMITEVGEVDILVNNAGLARFSPTADLPIETFDELFANNVRGPFLLVAAFAPKMAANGTGSIVNISSMSA